MIERLAFLLRPNDDSVVSILKNMLQAMLKFIQQFFIPKTNSVRRAVKEKLHTKEYYTALTDLQHMVIGPQYNATKRLFEKVKFGAEFDKWASMENFYIPYDNVLNFWSKEIRICLNNFTTSDKFSLRYVLEMIDLAESVKLVSEKYKNKNNHFKAETDVFQIYFFPDAHTIEDMFENSKFHSERTVRKYTQNFDYLKAEFNLKKKKLRKRLNLFKENEELTEKKKNSGFLKIYSSHSKTTNENKEHKNIENRRTRFGFSKIWSPTPNSGKTKKEKVQEMKKESGKMAKSVFSILRPISKNTKEKCRK